jgi:hypothetical protein
VTAPIPKTSRCEEYIPTKQMGPRYMHQCRRRWTMAVSGRHYCLQHARIHQKESHHGPSTQG